MGRFLWAVISLEFQTIQTLYTWKKCRQSTGSNYVETTVSVFTHWKEATNNNTCEDVEHGDPDVGTRRHHKQVRQQVGEGQDSVAVHDESEEHQPARNNTPGRSSKAAKQMGWRRAIQKASNEWQSFATLVSGTCSRLVGTVKEASQWWLIHRTKSVHTRECFGTGLPSKNFLGPLYPSRMYSQKISSLQEGLNVEDSEHTEDHQGGQQVTDEVVEEGGEPVVDGVHPRHELQVLRLGHAFLHQEDNKRANLQNRIVCCTLGTLSCVAFGSCLHLFLSSWPGWALVYTCCNVECIRDGLFLCWSIWKKMNAEHWAGHGLMSCPNRFFLGKELGAHGHQLSRGDCLFACQPTSAARCCRKGYIHNLFLQGSVELPTIKVQV